MEDFQKLNSAGQSETTFACRGNDTKRIETSAFSLSMFTTEGITLAHLAASSHRRKVKKAEENVVNKPICASRKRYID